MEFIKANYLDTTTLLTVGSGTDTTKYLFDTNTDLQYLTSNFNDDNTTASMTISFNSTLAVDRISLKNHNLKSFDIYYNGATANTFNFTNQTTVSQWTTNSETSLYLYASSPVNCTSVTIDMKSTIVADNEKAIGFLYITELDQTFSRIPSATNYSPIFSPMQIKHKLSDGGIRTHTVSQKFKAKIKLKYITETFRDNLKTLYDRFEPFGFVPFETGTGWDGFLQQVLWTGSFDFYKHADNAESTGFNGSINLEETPS